MNALVVSAHPDDEVIGMGGTLKKLSKANKISILFLSDGITSRRKSGYVNVPKYETTEREKKKMIKEIEIRKGHAKKALNTLGIKNMKFLDYPNNELDTIPFLKIVKHVEEEIQNSKPDLIFTHHFNDLNVDHRIAYQASITAARPLSGSKVNAIVSFESLSSTDWQKPYHFNPNLYVDITKELKIKIRAFEFYKNEIRDFPHPRSKEALEANSKRWGALSGFKAAEAFEIVLQRIKDFNSIFA